MGTCHQARLIYVFLEETGFLRVGQAGFELLTSSDLPTSAPQSVEIIGVSHLALPADFRHPVYAQIQNNVQVVLFHGKKQRKVLGKV